MSTKQSNYNTIVKWYKNLYGRPRLTLREAEELARQYLGKRPREINTQGVAMNNLVRVKQNRRETVV